MAKKISNFTYALIFAIFVFSALGTFIINADALFSTNDGVGTIINDASIDAQSEYLSTEQTIYNSTFETGTFSLPELQNVETRGTTQGVILAKNNPSTATNVIKNIGSYISIHPMLSALIISLIIFTASLLVIRLFLGENRT